MYTGTIGRYNAIPINSIIVMSSYGQCFQKRKSELILWDGDGTEAADNTGKKGDTRRNQRGYDNNSENFTHWLHFHFVSHLQSRLGLHSVVSTET